MNYLANYYVKSNFLPIANCISNRIGEGEDYKCDNAIVKNFLDTAGEEVSFFSHHHIYWIKKTQLHIHFLYIVNI